jgi:hypothetical protein
MLRTLSVLATVFLTAFSAGQLLAQGPEIIDPAEAAKDPDFSIQGEYLGQGGGAASLEGKVAVQVIARGGGKFQAFVLKGGLPGEGWKNGDPRSGIEGKREGDKVMLKGGNFAATIADGKLTLTTTDGQGTAELKPVQRKSPTLCAPPPQGALVLFDGTDAKHFPDGHMTADKNLMGGCVTADKFNDYHLHVELRLSYMPNAQGQARSNSGVYLHDCYEIQVLDSFGLEGLNNECGGFYSVQAPKVNMCLPPLVWQTYDVDFTAPKYDASGKKTADARATVLHNGVMIHDDYQIPHDTPGRQREGPGPRPLHLQGHGNHVEFRNVWVVEKK